MSPGARELVLLVDDAPESLGALCTELEHEGCTVLVAASGDEALRRLDLVNPDVILLDARMPGMDGFATCRRIKAQPAWAHIPVIFMTGLTDTEHIVEGFAAGGVDYVAKPLRTAEVLARLATHVRNARAVRLAREAVDVAGMGVLMVDAHGRMAWRSPLAQRWLQEFFGDAEDEVCVAWLNSARDGAPAPRAGAAGGALSAQALGTVGLGETLWLLHVQPSAESHAARLARAALTPREAEVLSWLAKGKTNRDIADILGMSPRTVNKHLEHVFAKLGVETRAAAAALASRARQ